MSARMCDYSIFVDFSCDETGLAETRCGLDAVYTLITSIENRGLCLCPERMRAVVKILDRLEIPNLIGHVPGYVPKSNV